MTYRVFLLLYLPILPHQFVHFLAFLCLHSLCASLPLSPTFFPSLEHSPDALKRSNLLVRSWGNINRALARKRSLP